MRATSRDGSLCMALPSKVSWPSCGRNSRARVFNRVDLPHALGPTMTVKEPSGIARSNPSTTTRSS